MAIITLTTDFGWQDWFVGTVKGVVLGIQPEARIIDLSHGIPAGDIQAGALALAAAFGFFPPGSIHMAVVDPGVGSSRRAIAVQTKNYFFVGPDNGVLSLALAREPGPQTIHAIENRRFLLPNLSRTFHARDVFGPASAWLSRGTPLSELGPRVDEMERLRWSAPVEMNGRWTGSIIYIDHFGNALTNFSEEHPVFQKPRIQVRVPGKRASIPLCSSYSAVKKGKPLAILGSSGWMEMAINGGNAARTLALSVGSPVTVRIVGRDLVRKLNGQREKRVSL